MSTTVQVAIEPSIEDIYPLTPMQGGLLSLTLRNPESRLFYGQCSYVLNGDINLPAFEAAWEQVFQSHSILRTSIMWEDLDEPVQVVLNSVPLPLSVHDWRHVPECEREQRLEAFLGEDRRRGLDLAKAPLMRIALLRVADDCHYLVWSHHHIIMDGWSAALVLQELTASYVALCRGRALELPAARPFRDYVNWLQGQDQNDAEAFWRRTLSGFETPTPLPSGDVTSQSGHSLRQIRLSAQTSSAIRAMAVGLRLTLNAVFQGAWALLIGRYSGVTDVVFGTTVSTRPAALEGSEYMVGLFINTLPVRTQLDPSRRLSAWLAEIQMQQADARQFDYSPLVEVQSWSDLPRGSEMFQSIVVYQNYPTRPLGKGSVPEAAPEQLQARDIRSIETGNYPLELKVGPDEEILIKIDYDCAHYAPGTIERLLDSYEVLLEGMVERPEGYLSELPLLSERQREQVLSRWNETRREYPAQCVHQLIQEHAFIS